MRTLISLFFFAVCFMQTYAQELVSSYTIGNEAKTYSKVLVIVKVKNDSHRKEMENDIVKRLMSKKIQAIPSHLHLTREMLEEGEKNSEELELFVTALREKEFDGILVSNMVEADQTVEYNPAKYRTTRVPVRYGRFGRYYGSTQVRVYEPASVEKEQNFVLESLLYDLRVDAKEVSLHWIGTIKISDPASFDKASAKYAKTLVKGLSKEAFN